MEGHDYREKGVVRPAGRASGERERQQGMTLVLSLGFLSVFLVLMMTMAALSRTEQRSAVANADSVRARMLAESAMDRAVSSASVACTSAGLWLSTSNCASHARLNSSTPVLLGGSMPKYS